MKDGGVIVVQQAACIVVSAGWLHVLIGVQQAACNATSFRQAVISNATNITLLMNINRWLVLA